MKNFYQNEMKVRSVYLSKDPLNYSLSAGEYYGFNMRHTSDEKLPMGSAIGDASLNQFLVPMVSFIMPRVTAIH
jgi:hypothetical protein